MILSDERGETFIEILITVVVMSIVMVAILGSMGTTTAAGTTHRKQSELQMLLISAAERVKSNTEVPYVSCATPTTSSYATAAGASTLPVASATATQPHVTGSAVSISSVGYWNGTTFSTLAANCHDDVGRLRLQQIKLTGTSGTITETITVLKGDPQ